MMLPIQNWFARVNYVKLLLFSFMAVVVGFGFFGYLFPKLIRIAMRVQTRITPGTMTRKIFERIPFALNYKLYMFNITNKDEVLAGAKPIMQEIGPYYFE